MLRARQIRLLRLPRKRTAGHQLLVSTVMVTMVGFLGVVTTSGSASATPGFIGSYCRSYQYACVSGGYAATAATTGNSWAWRYYGADIGTPSGNHNCTLYVAWRLQQEGMPNPGRSWGDASNWGASLGYNHTPTVGSVAWWKGGDHVAFVEQVSADGTQVYVRADNYVTKGSGGYTDAGWVSVNGPTGFLHPYPAGEGGGGGTATSRASLAKNGGYEQGTSSWHVEPSSNFVAYSNGQVTAAEAGRDGTHYAATNTTVSGGGFYQDITETINPGETYCASAFVRSQYGGTASGSMALWLIGGTGQDSAGTGYSHLGTLNNWTPIESCVTATTAHTTLRVQFYPTPNGGTTDVDDISSYLAPSIQAVARQQPPVISGTPRVGTQLSATAGTWSPSGASYTYQWRANDKDITGATKSTYKPGPAMVGKTISVRVTASEAGYQPASATSAETQSVAKGVTRCVTAPKVSGTTGVGSTLTASTGAWKPGELTYHYQWLRNGTPIAKATGRTYKLKAADKNHWIRVQVTATRTGWTTVSRTSASTARIRG